MRLIHVSTPARAVARNDAGGVCGAGRTSHAVISVTAPGTAPVGLEASGNPNVILHLRIGGASAKLV
jgi:hypothetical protein